MISRLEEQWGEVRSIAHRRAPIDPPYEFFDVISQMPTEHAFEAIEYVRQVRGFPTEWGFYEAELLGILESFIGQSIRGGVSASYATFLEMSFSTMDALGLHDKTLDVWSREALERGALARGSDEPPSRPLRRYEAGVPFIHRHELAPEGHLVYQYYRHEEVDRRIVEPLRCRGPRFTTRRYAYYVVRLEEALEHFGQERADTMRYLWRVQGDGSLFDALRSALQLPSTWAPECLLSQGAHAEAGFGSWAVSDERRAWWLAHIRDVRLRAHLSNFVHEVGGDRHPLGLSFHPVWEEKGISFLDPYLLDCPKTQRPARVLLAWTCEYFDTMDKAVLVRWDTPSDAT